MKDDDELIRFDIVGIADPDNNYAGLTYLYLPDGVFCTYGDAAWKIRKANKRIVELEKELAALKKSMWQERNEISRKNGAM